MTKYRHMNRNWDRNPEERDPPKTCPVSGKQMHSSERDAKAAVKHRMNTQEFAPANLRTYKCQYCGAWHLTSKEK